ncbi:hypothetical protein WDW86_05325 [Bdellovibrionota bacterium FG-2]
MKIYPSSMFFRVFFTFFMLLSFAPQGFSWEKHESFMPWVIADAPPNLATALGTPLGVLPTALPNKAFYQNLAKTLVLNPGVVLAEPTPTPARPSELLLGSVIDEPDKGMDENLETSADPENMRQFMGGAQGVTSKGFRHMYFGGLKLGQPFATFQIPTHAMGLAPRRIALLAQESKNLFKSGNIYWGTRVLGWAMHLLQDLAQPFHAVQIPNLMMVPWEELFNWPPSKMFSSLVSETTRTISNYHWAYEDFILLLISQKDLRLSECLKEADKKKTVREVSKNLDKDFPGQLAFAVAAASAELSSDLGKAEMELFGKSLKQKGVDLPKNQGTPNYADLSIRPDLLDARQALLSVSCKALSNAIWASRGLIDWAFQP